MKAKSLPENLTPFSKVQKQNAGSNPCLPLFLHKNNEAGYLGEALILSLKGLSPPMEASAFALPRFLKGKNDGRNTGLY